VGFIGNRVVVRLPREKGKKLPRLGAGKLQIGFVKDFQITIELLSGQRWRRGLSAENQQPVLRQKFFCEDLQELLQRRIVRKLLMIVEKKPGPGRELL